MLTLRPVADGAFGTTLVPPPGATHVAVDGPRLHAIDLTSSQELEVLDLRHGPAGLHLTVQHCPALRKILVPELGWGATLHIDFGPRPPRLQVEGRVAYLDACWRATNGRAGGGLQPPSRRRRRPARTGAWIGPPAAESWACELVMLVSGDDREIEAPPTARVRELLVQGLPQLSSVRMPARRALDALEAIDCPALARVEAFWVSELRVRQPAPNLRVHASGHFLGLGDSEGPCTEGHVVGRWDSRPQQRRRSQAGRISFAIDPDRFLWLVGAEATPEQRARAALESVDRGTDSKTLLAVLELLDHEGRAGCDPALLWSLRCVLHAFAALQRRRSYRADETWSWSFPADLGSRGWDADLRIWRRCAPHVPDAAAYRSVLEHSAQTVHLATFARALWRERIAADVAIDPTLVDLLHAGLWHGAQLGSQLVREPGGYRPAPAPQLLDELRTVLRTLAGLAQHPRCLELLEAFCAYVHHRLPCEAGIGLLKTLHLLGSQAATARLTALATDPRVAEGEQRIALLSGLAAVQRPILRLEHPGGPV